MASELKDRIAGHIKDKVNVIGFAPVDRFEGAPEAHHPKRLCKDARTVIVFGITVPKGVFTAPAYNLHFLHRSYHTIYRHLDVLAVELCNFIESCGSYRATPAPSYAPMVFEDMEPWGLLSLKHAAVNAGLGAFGRSGQVYHPQWGGLVRLAAVITNAELPGDPMNEADPCPPNCRACFQACPSQAFRDDGLFNKMTCLSHSVKHAIYPLALKDEAGLKNIERVVNTAGHDYWIACTECVRVCPLNR
ncbi:MAG: epoxyqueuosine reductase [Deltaproteobacteria bacterium]|nr:epoxyqueuosine reductase [Deltaproteobacteria bacterium]